MLTTKVPVHRSAHSAERWGFESDIHAPFQDPEALSIAVDVMKDWEIETLVINGDLVDFYRISRFEKDAERGVKLQFELTASKEVLRDSREAFPEARILFVPGNHDLRMGRFCNLHPEIAGLQALQLENLLEFERFQIELMPDQFVIEGAGLL